MECLGERDPAPGRFDPPATAPEPAFAEVLTKLWSLRTFRWVALGTGLASFAGTGLGMWMPVFLERVHELPKTEIGVRFGIIQYGTAFFGAILAGKVADALGRRSLRWYAGVGAISIALM